MNARRFGERSGRLEREGRSRNTDWEDIAIMRSGGNIR